MYTIHSSSTNSSSQPLPGEALQSSGASHQQQQQQQRSHSCSFGDMCDTPLFSSSDECELCLLGEEGDAPHDDVADDVSLAEFACDLCEQLGCCDPQSDDQL
jgi:hypothetical protein